MAQAPATRLGAAHRRAFLAKLVLAGGGVLAFAASAALARVAYPGHAKRSPRALSPPPRFVEIVRENQLESGILAPAEAPPEATSGPT
ncbi:MAG: hypothetical protein M3R39_07285 [Actinomycetota bacterium]|nr:hypothetical protein [Actinomycetota bacterium]